MSSHIIDKIRDTIRNDNYDMTSHAFEEMAEDNLSICDVENAILTGKIIKKEKDDPRECIIINVNTVKVQLRKKL